MPLLLFARLARSARTFLTLMRRPEMVVFLPAITLAAFWFGGERVLVLVALGGPLILAVSGVLQQSEQLPPALPS